MMLKIAYSDIYNYNLPEGHRFPMDKYELLPQQLLYEGTISEDAFFEPPALSDEDILTTHDSKYLNQLNKQQLSYKEIRKIGFPMSPMLVNRGKHIANGTFLCAQYAMKHGVSMNVAGGTHHAFADHGEGFCVFNDIAIASNLLLKKKLANKILVIDLDVHQGNGTAAIFNKNSSVFTFSMHGAKNYPIRKEKSDLDIDLPDNTEDEAYLKILKETLPKLMDTVQPDFIFYLAGADVINTDKLGRLALTIDGAKKRDEMVFKECRLNSVPVAVTMGGGYSEKLTNIIDTHANTFRTAQYIYF